MRQIQTKADRAYSALRRAIVVGEIPANAALDENELMERLAAGRTPVREALKRLALEQFVMWPPRRTPYVLDLSSQDLHRLYESRFLLEEPAARLAATRISAAQLEHAQQLCDDLTSAASQGDVYASIEADHALHMAITRGSDNRFLTEAVDRLNCGSLRLWYVAHERLGLEDVPADHQEILDALRTRDPERAASAVRRHIQLSLDRQMKVAFGGIPSPSTLPAHRAG